jgi:4a-hydroxytetrahydrobiopterin dehydratase
MNRVDRTYSEPEILAQLRELPGWGFRQGAIRRSFATDGWPSTMLVVNAIAFACEAAGHHPDLAVSWGKVEVSLWTHSAKGITEKDFETAALIERTILWGPDPESSLSGPPKPFVR